MIVLGCDCDNAICWDATVRDSHRGWSGAPNGGAVSAVCSSLSSSKSCGAGIGNQQAITLLNWESLCTCRGEQASKLLNWESLCKVEWVCSAAVNSAP